MQRDYIVNTADTLETAIQKIKNKETDLIISAKNLNGYHAFDVYNQLKKHLNQAGIPFFMVLDEYVKEDVLLGLEMGIDNFLFSPFKEPVIIHTIENRLKKTDDINLFETELFKYYFLSSLTAMFFESDGKISHVNEAFCELTGACGNHVIGTSADELFTLEESETNRINYRRFRSGVDHYCHMHGIKWKKNWQSTYDITFYRRKTSETNHVFAEMIASFNHNSNHNSNQNNNPDELAPVNYQQTVVKEKIKCEVRLTKREKQVYILSAEGMALKQIAAELNLSQRTVEKHRANIMQKTKTTNFIETMVKIGHISSNLSE